MNKIFSLQKKLCLFIVLVGCSFCFVLASIIPIKLAVAHHQFTKPNAILTLGGNVDREYFTAKFAQTHPSLPIWVSSGVPIQLAFSIFQDYDIAKNRIHLDRRAVDTVTNFTSLVKDFQQRDIHHIYLITSDFHMARAKAIAFFVLGSRGIAFTPVCYFSNQPSESWLKIFRDTIRSVFWILTSHTGATLNPRAINIY